MHTGKFFQNARKGQCEDKELSSSHGAGGLTQGGFMTVSMFMFHVHKLTGVEPRAKLKEAQESYKIQPTVQ